MVRKEPPSISSCTRTSQNIASASASRSTTGVLDRSSAGSMGFQSSARETLAPIVRDKTRIHDANKAYLVLIIKFAPIKDRKNQGAQFGTSDKPNVVRRRSVLYVNAGAIVNELGPAKEKCEPETARNESVTTSKIIKRGRQGPPGPSSLMRQPNSDARPLM